MDDGSTIRVGSTMIALFLIVTAFLADVGNVIIEGKGGPHCGVKHGSVVVGMHGKASMKMRQGRGGYLLD